MRGKFIVIEGNECTGKTTQCQLLVDRLRENDIPVSYERESTTGVIGTLIREKYLSGSENPDPNVMAHLFLADRYEHITHPTKGMLFKLQNGINIICDRFYLSSIVCQSVNFRGTDKYWEQMHRLINMHNHVRSIIKPDLNLMLKLPPEKSYEYATGRGNQSIFENELKILQDIYCTYDDALKEIYSAWKEEYKELDGDGTLNIVHERIWRQVYPLLNHQRNM